MAYAVVRTDNMSGIIDGKNLVALRYDSDIENGHILEVGAYEPGHREMRVGVTPGANTPIEKLVLVASEERDKTKTYSILSDFINKKGEEIRGYRLTTNDIFSVTKEGFDGDEPAVGKIVSIKNSTKMTLGDTVDGTEIGEVVLIEGEWVVVQVK